MSTVTNRIQPSGFVPDYDWSGNITTLFQRDPGENPQMILTQLDFRSSPTSDRLRSRSQLSSRLWGRPLSWM